MTASISFPGFHEGVLLGLGKLPEGGQVDGHHVRGDCDVQGLEDLSTSQNLPSTAVGVEVMTESIRPV